MYVLAALLEQPIKVFSKLNTNMLESCCTLKEYEHVDPVAFIW